MNKPRKTLALVFASLLLAVSTACASTEPSAPSSSDPQASTGGAPSSTASESVELTYYFPVQTSGPLASAMEQIVTNFNSSHSGITVNPVFTGNYSATLEKTMTAVTAGNPPHVVLSGGTDVTTYTAVDALYNIKDFLDAEGPEFKSDFIDAFWGTFEIDGGVYGLPYQHSTPIAYYNKDLFSAAGLDPENPPLTWEDTLTAAKKLQAANGDVIPLELSADPWILEALAMSNGGGIVENRSTLTFDSSPSVEALSFLKTMMLDDKTAVSRKYGETSEDFIAESTAIMYNSIGSMGAVASGASFNWDVAPIPVSGSNLSKIPYGGGGMVMLAGHPDNETKSAWEFMKYMTTPEITAKWSMTSGYYAVRKSSYELDEMKDYIAELPQMQKAVDMLQNAAAPWMPEKNYGEINNRLQLAMDNCLIQGSESPSQALAQAQQDSLELLEK